MSNEEYTHVSTPYGLSYRSLDLICRMYQPFNSVFFTTNQWMVLSTMAKQVVFRMQMLKASWSMHWFPAVVFLLPCEDCVVVEIISGRLSLWNLCAHRAFVLAVCLVSGLASAAALGRAFDGFVLCTGDSLPRCTSGSSVCIWAASCTPALVFK